MSHIYTIFATELIYKYHSKYWWWYYYKIMKSG